MYSIGEFSRITKLTVTTLRHYHAIDLLTPVKVDTSTGYRFYNADQIQISQIIIELVNFGFSLDEVKTIVQAMVLEKDVRNYLTKQKSVLQNQIKGLTSRISRIELILKEKEQLMESYAETLIIEKELPDLLVAFIRHQGRYQEIGPLFGRLGRACGPKICGPALALYYDSEYKEDNAIFEACMPVRAAVNKDDIRTQKIKGGKAVTIIHKGPYDVIGGAYKKILDFVKNKKTNFNIPTREVYLKGPGFLFRNPKKYITEIQFLIQ